MDSYSYISNAHPDYIENLYRDFQKDPKSVDEEIRKFFEGYDFASRDYSENGEVSQASIDEFKVYRLISAYRKKGHLIADTNPIKKRKDRHAHLELESFGLSEKDLDRSFVVGTEVGIGTATLRDILKHMQTAYCSSFGFEFEYIREPEERLWFKEKIERHPSFYQYPIEKKEKILRKLNKAVVFENFLGRKYIGEKRFSLEGGETTIPALDAIINTGADLGAEEVVIGMAHRGRLNVLANLLGKTYEEIFNEFEGNEPDDPAFGDGDVKYHLGFSSQFKTDSGKEIMLRLAPNPSHLEAVDGVVEGYARAKADQHYDSKYDKIVPLLIHGDAAVAGQGVVYEVLQMAKLRGYFTGGTIHFVINNQIGFTTDFDDARSSDYCTSIAATIHAPVIHVNGDDIEAVIYAAEMAAEYRQKFNKDIFVDMVCFRRHGHNESDDPKYTQPNMYSAISKHPNQRDIYSKKLIESGEIEAELAKKMDKEFWDDLQADLDQVKQNPPKFKRTPPESGWRELRMAEGEDFEKSPETGISKRTIKTIVEALSTVPEGFAPLRKVDKYLKGRREIMATNKTVDWAAAELLAYGSILMDGKDVRMSGQDVRRGTFSHRHAIIYDEKTNEEYNRLGHLSKDQGRFMIYNSHLSEYGVLAFEYGYSVSSPKPLVIWEAQFGDFSNTAQAVIDQFISSSETKWQINSGMVLLLPHGYEGMGPEHSSARLERFLTGCAELNWVVTNITTSSNFFHALRRQLAWEFRKPLIVMSPKAMLRDKRSQSPIEEVVKGRFKEIIDDPNVKDPKKVKRLLLCSGKVYFNLEEKKLADKRDDVAVVRLEQLYPLATGQLNAIIEKYKGAEIFWVQEEPQNMGAWPYILSMTHEHYKIQRVARKASASPATGFKKQHDKELTLLLDQAFA